MSTTPNNCPLLCACGVSYNIGGDLTQEPYYSGAGFSSANPPIVVGSDPSIATAIMGTTSEGIVIAFTGTIANSLESWLTDLLLIPQNFPGFPGNVHTGFYACVMLIMQDVESNLSALLQANPKAQINITGHSKGGGMASIAAWYLSQVSSLAIPASQINVCTFASPAPGDADFATGYQALFSQTNYINYLDMVPFLPPSAMTSEVWADIYNSASALAASEGLTDLAKVLGDLASVFSTCEAWNYTAVSTTDMFIKKDGSVSDSILLYPVFYAALTEALCTLQIQKVLSAHSHLCGGGYMNAVCQGMCSQSAA